MIILGDIHGEHERAFKLARKNPKDTIIQLGDFGLGFKEFPPFPDNLSFIRGNHDSPEACHKHPKYLGDYGFKYVDGQEVFFLSGADSIDKNQRIEGVSWWRNEQLSYRELQDAIDLYECVKPKHVISHDGPQSIVEKMFGVYGSTQTRTALQLMLEAHKPELWYFGHWHRTKTLRGSTNFMALPEFGVTRFGERIISGNTVD
jgi:hypothetical protein